MPTMLFVQLEFDLQCNFFPKALCQYEIKLVDYHEVECPLSTCPIFAALEARFLV